MHLAKILDTGPVALMVTALVICNAALSLAFRIPDLALKQLARRQTSTASFVVGADSTTTVDPSTTNVVTSVISASSVAPTTAIFTSVITQSTTSAGEPTNAITVVITSTPEETTAGSSSYLTNPETVVLTGSSGQATALGVDGTIASAQPTTIIQTITSLVPFSTQTLYNTFSETDQSGSVVTVVASQHEILAETQVLLDSYVLVPTTSATSSASNPATVSHGLSSGAKAGIGVAAAVAALAGAGATYLFFRRRRQGKSSTRNDDYAKPELDGNAKAPPAELASGDPKELTDSARHELRAGEVAGELTGSQVKRQSIIHELASP